MMSCNFRFIEVIEPSTLTTLQTVIPAPGSNDLVTLHLGLLCTSATKTLASGYACFILKILIIIHT